MENGKHTTACTLPNKPKQEEENSVRSLSTKNKKIKQKYYITFRKRNGSTEKPSDLVSFPNDP